MSAPNRRRRTLLAAVVTVLLAVPLLAACGGSGTKTQAGAQAIPKDIADVMGKAAYAHSRWGLAVRDLDSGKTLLDLNSNEFFPPGSTTKVFTGIPTWDALTPEHTFTTPVYATAAPTGDTLNGSLVMVAQGDLVFGGRAKPDGTVDFTKFDHMEANEFPGFAILTPEDPLAAIDSIATQIAATGVRHINGDVVIDDRLWKADQELSGIPLNPMMINENVIDMTVTGHAEGQPADFTYRPAISTMTVKSTVTAGKAGDPANLTITPDQAGNITISGTVPPDGKPIVQVSEITKPSDFARVALIDALGKRGVTVSAPTAAANPAGLLPGDRSYAGAQRLAAYTSPPWSEYEKMILKVSHNRGADTNMCLLALTKNQSQCAAGLPMVFQFLTTHGVPGDAISFADGRGGLDGDLTTPNAALAVLKYISTRPDAAKFKQSLPILGRDGTIADDEKTSPAAGHVFAKTGTVAGGDVAGNRLALIAETLIGYIDASSGRHLEFALYVNNLLLDNPTDILHVFSDQDHIAALLYDRF